MFSGKALFVTCTIVTVVGIGLGVIIGYFSHPSNDVPIYVENEAIATSLMKEMKSENIKNYLR